MDVKRCFQVFKNFLQVFLTESRGSARCNFTKTIQQKIGL